MHACEYDDEESEIERIIIIIKDMGFLSGKNFLFFHIESPDRFN